MFYGSGLTIIILFQNYSIDMQSSTESGEEYIVKINPATLEEFGKVKCNTADDVSIALQNARNAQYEWMKKSYNDKAVIMNNIQESIISNIDDIARTICGETGNQRVKQFLRTYLLH